MISDPDLTPLGEMSFPSRTVRCLRLSEMCLWYPASWDYSTVLFVRKSMVHKVETPSHSVLRERHKRLLEDDVPYPSSADWIMDRQNWFYLKHLPK